MQRVRNQKTSEKRPTDYGLHWSIHTIPMHIITWAYSRIGIGSDVFWECSTLEFKSSSESVVEMAETYFCLPFPSSSTQVRFFFLFLLVGNGKKEGGWVWDLVESQGKGFVGKRLCMACCMPKNLPIMLLVSSGSGKSE